MNTLTKIKNLFETVKDVVKNLSENGAVLSKNPEQRMATCLECECFDGTFCSGKKCTGEDGKAQGCGCYMALKTQLEASKCPRKKWD